MYLHATILKVSTNWLSNHDIYKLLAERGFTGCPETVAKERRVLSNRDLMESKVFKNEGNNGTHKRHRRARTKRLRK